VNPKLWWRGVYILRRRCKVNLSLGVRDPRVNRTTNYILRRRCKVNQSLGVRDPRVTGPPTLTLKAWINPKRLKHTFGVPFLLHHHLGSQTPG